MRGKILMFRPVNPPTRPPAPLPLPPAVPFAQDFNLGYQRSQERYLASRERLLRGWNAFLRYRAVCLAFHVKPATDDEGERA